MTDIYFRDGYPERQRGWYFEDEDRTEYGPYGTFMEAKAGLERVYSYGGINSMKREEITTLLKEHILLVSFTKKDGTEREMRCTLKNELLPQKAVDAAKWLREDVADLVVAWDLEKNDWRSFLIPSIKRLNVVSGPNNTVPSVEIM